MANSSNNNVKPILQQQSSIIDELDKIEKFFQQLQKPKNLYEIRDRAHRFCQQNLDRKIVLITSGGTTVPMEHNTVRFIDNFSAGTRGSASVEYFFDTNKYAVIFLYRQKSLEPFSRHFDGLLSNLKYDPTNDRIEVSEKIRPKLVQILTKMNETSNRLLKITFTTLSEYLFILRELTALLKPYESRVMLYLAAAVSDFYIPPDNMAVHKIHSNGPLRLHFEMVPKILRPLVKFWVPDAFVISFKLETEAEILLEKAREALNRYGHKLVIANELNTRKWKVILVTADESEDIEIDPNSNQLEIEQLIVANVIRRHEKFIDNHREQNSLKK
ncbi:phosphopantothenate-cysteine ligase-like protein [Dermatophagoides farinae]|uniref:Phosphopantothenate-cysteine ligase-like protein n=1 Tax=Dermatophagoides farinae TaxID=6954 RepID=A0A9D4SEG0_DERFA|nr:uncharacterized protein C4B3.18-like [Dermatophagoides farinae]KAH7638678.1 phosphopantothenate-cysteine ligase-like protein [Dermatophagoides farinae]